jgi:hypothetical protein
VVAGISAKVQLQIEQTSTKAKLEVASAVLPLKRWHLESLADDGSGHQILVDHAKSRLQETLQGLLSRGMDLKVPLEGKTYLSQAYVDAHDHALTKADEGAVREAVDNYNTYYGAVRIHTRRESHGGAAQAQR